MPSAPVHAVTSRTSRQSPFGAPIRTRSPTHQDGGPPPVPFGIYPYGETSLLHMPSEIIMAILIEWSMLEWFAPATVRRICRSLKEITDDSPRAWSKLFLPHNSRATSVDVRKWLERGKAAPKEICLASKDICTILAALEGAKDATSLIVQIPIFKDILQQKQVRLPLQMPRLRQLQLSSHSTHVVMGLSNIFGSSHNLHFPCLTILHLSSISLTGFRINAGSFPAMRRLVLRGFLGPILDLIQICSGSLEDLRVTMDLSQESSPQGSPHARICLPNLKLLIVDDAQGIVSKLEAPNLRVICADLDEINGSTRPFSSVVEWATRQSPYQLEQTDITGHLNNMPQLRNLLLLQHMETLKGCFECLRDNPEICPKLQLIEVVEFAGSDPEFELDTESINFLKMCMEGRANAVSGFTLRFVENIDQEEWLEQYYEIDVCSFTQCVITCLIMLLEMLQLVRMRNDGSCFGTSIIENSGFLSSPMPG